MTISIQFEVEDGTGKTNATTYASITQYKQYWLNRMITITDSDTVIEGLLNVAAEYIDLNFKFIGFKSDVEQRREWPRCINDQSIYNDMIDSDEIPVEIVDACCYLAYQNKLNNLWPIDGGVSSRSIGPVSTSYKRYEGFKSFPYVDTLLSKYLSSMPGIIRVN